MRGPRFTVENEAIRLPQPPAPQVSPQAFFLFPLPVCCPAQLAIQQWLYQQAFEKAKAAARPSLIERDLCGVWN